jgi:hypothetical protein
MIVYRSPRRVAGKYGIRLVDLLAHCERGEIRCSKCKRFKLAETHFYRNKHTVTGYAQTCRECLGYSPKQDKPLAPNAIRRVYRGPRAYRCDYCNHSATADGSQEISLAGKVWRVHLTCARPARAFVYGEPQRDPVVEQ